MYHIKRPRPTSRGRHPGLLFNIKNVEFMPNYNRVETGKKASFTISSIDETSTGTGYLLSVKNTSGRTEFSRVYIPKGDVDQFEIGKSIELYPWSMPIVPVKCNRNGELRTYRSVSGFSFNEAEAEAAALRSAQNLYDQAVEICNTQSTRAAAGDYFANFVERNEFLKALEAGGI